MNFETSKYLVNQPLRLLSKGKLSVFLFHKVPKIVDPLMAHDLDLDGFNQVIDFVEERFKVIPLADAAEYIQRGKLPDASACITFDDGYASWFDGAIPALERRNMHATFFITTGQFQGLPMWHERLACAITALPGPQFILPGFGLPALPLANLNDKRKTFSLIESYLKYQQLEVRDHLIDTLERAAGVMPSNLPLMTVAQLRNLHSRGFGVGAHTVTHPILAICDEKTAMREIVDVRDALQSIVGGAVNSFAYPNGRPNEDFSLAHVRMVKAAGYTHAVTTQWGAATVNTPIFEIPRFTPWGPSVNRMALQVARNLITPPRRTYTRTCKHTGLDQTPVDNVPILAKPVVLFVENGSGFGGAIVALQTLLENLPVSSGAYHIVTNLPVGHFGKIPSVISQHIIPDRFFNARALAKTVEAWGIWWPSKTLLFMLGRLDDLVNRVPYFTRLALHAWRLKPDLIHGNNEPNANREAMLVAKLLRVPYVQHVRGQLGASRHTPWLLQGSAAFIPVSRWLAGELAVSGVPCSRIRQIYDAVDLAPKAIPGTERSLRAELGLAEGVALVAMIGMLVSWKGQDLFINAIKQVIATDKKIAYLVIGGTPERGDMSYALALKEQASLSGLQDQINFMGRRDDMPVLLPQIDIVVSASTQPEPLGLVMLEAMVNGCIFIGPKFGAATEIIEDGKNGYLFEPQASDSLAQKIQIAVDNLRQSSKIQLEAKNLVLNKFSGERCGEETLRAYRSVMGK